MIRDGDYKTGGNYTQPVENDYGDVAYWLYVGGIRTEQRFTTDAEAAHKLREILNERRTVQVG